MMTYQHLKANNYINSVLVAFIMFLLSIIRDLALIDSELECGLEYIVILA